MTRAEWFVICTFGPAFAWLIAGAPGFFSAW